MSETQNHIFTSFDMIPNREYTEEDLMLALGDRIAEMLEFEPDLLFSTLYRLDISERKINEALHQGEADIHLKLARLVLDRQKAKLETKKKYGFQELDDPDLSL